MERRRHSVDIPISRAIVALRRVRSLRDPSTNSLSKFSSLPENANWETSSINEISLGFMNANEEWYPDTRGISRFQTSGLSGPRKERGGDNKLDCHLGKSMFKLVAEEHSDCIDKVDVAKRMRKSEGFDTCGSNSWSNHGDEGLHLECISPSNCCLEGAGSTNELNIGSPQANSTDQSVSRSETMHMNQFKSTRIVGNHLIRADSPSLSVSEAFSSHSTSLIGNEDSDFLVQNVQGCGISCCWTRTPRFRESAAYSDREGHPLLSRDVAKSTSFGPRSCIHNCDPTPRSLYQKFGPKSFNELVGQNVVTRSLLGAISTGRITSLYLFHGPRGTGKTLASRIFAAALNCISVEEHKPCGCCQECVLFFSGRSGDVKEVDSVKINRAERIRSLVKNASKPPTSSRFKVFIVDECHLLHEETWVTLMNRLENLSRYVVFVMITPDLDKLPRSAVTRSQRFYFPKLKDNDIAKRLENICLQDGLHFDHDALEFIATKSNGSLRDAEVMLDQLSLLGKKITMSLAHELIGVVSDDELLDLLGLALSSDTSNTVIRARELMRSRIDPMQLVSQLANLIMDILAGQHQDSTEVRRSFSKRHASEADMQRLSYALKVLSETEKQLRMAKNQSTWLTVALLQLSSSDSSSLDANESKSSLRNSHERDGDFCSTSSPGESLKHLGHCTCEPLCKLGMQEDRTETLVSIWNRAIELCQSDSFKSFLRMRGKLSSLSVVQDLAVAELEFYQPDHVFKAEKSWKAIATSLQTVLGCNVEIRINLVPTTSVSKCGTLRKVSFSLFNCSRRMQQKSHSTMEFRSNSDSSDHISEQPMIRGKAVLICKSDFESQASHECSHREHLVKSLRSGGNLLTTVTTSLGLPQDGSSITRGEVDSSSEVKNGSDIEVSPGEQTEEQTHCFPMSLRLHKKLHLFNSSPAIHMGNEQENKFFMSMHGVKSFETDSYVFSSNNCSTDSRSDDRLKDDSFALCWKTPTFPLSKAWEVAQQRRRSPLVGWVLPCANAE